MINLDMLSSADWSNAVWKLVENHWTMDEKQSAGYQLEFPGHPEDHIPRQKMTLCLNEIVQISKEILNRVNLKTEEKLKIALFLIDAGKACERIEKIKKFNPCHQKIEDDKAGYELIEVGKSVLNQQKLRAMIEIAYVDNSVDTPNVFQNTDLMIPLVSEILTKAGYDHNPSEIKIDISQTHKIIILETTRGKKFIKINARGGGLNEYLGTLFFKDDDSQAPEVPVIPAEKLIVSQHVELLIQSFIPIAFAEGGTLFEGISQMEFQKLPHHVELIKSILLDSLRLSKSTMSYSLQPARNDDLFFDRLKTESQDGISGRIERIYAGKKFKLQNLEISWEELKSMHWTIDGIAYKETIEELLQQAREDLDPEKPRLMGISHGDWHENNVIVKVMNDNNDGHSYAYIDLERSGQNDLIEDAALFLTHLTIYADYINLKYSPHLFKGNKIVAKSFEKSCALKDRQMTADSFHSLIDLQGIGSFGTLESRLKIAKLFIDYYYKPLVNEAISKYHIKAEEFDNHLKSAILLRLIGGREVTKWIARDQMKLIGLIYKSLATPINNGENKPVLERFINALKDTNHEEFCDIDLVRHGETDWNKAGRIHGFTDIPLNQRGEKQAQELSEKLKDEDYSVFFSSDLDRAYKTSTIIRGARTFEVIKSKELRERFFDIWEGKASKLIKKWDKEHSKELKKLTKKEYLDLKKSPNMESVTEVFQRIKRFIDSQAPWYLGSRIFIGTHGGVLRAILESLETDDLQRKWTIDNCSILRLRYNYNDKTLSLVSSEGIKFKIKK